jgi:protein-tyrosine phosphatase
MIPIGQPRPLTHPVLPRGARLWGAGRPGYPDEPPPPEVVDAGANAWAESGVSVVVSLIEDWEIPKRAPGLYEALARHGMTLVRFPVPDFGAPSDIRAFADVLTDVQARLRSGQGVLAHCNAGLGRTAVLLAALLKGCGFEGDAVEEIRRIYQLRAMETPAQEAFVRGLAFSATEKCRGNRPASRGVGRALRPVVD